MRITVLPMNVSLLQTGPPMNVALIGCGGVGMKRARALPPNARLAVVCDVMAERARAVSAALGGAASVE